MSRGGVYLSPRKSDLLWKSQILKVHVVMMTLPFLTIKSVANRLCDLHVLFALIVTVNLCYVLCYGFEFISNKILVLCLLIFT